MMLTQKFLLAMGQKQEEAMVEDLVLELKSCFLSVVVYWVTHI